MDALWIPSIESLSMFSCGCGADVRDPANLKNTMLYCVMCEQKFFTYNYFHSIFPVVFVSRTNLFLFTTFRSRQTYTPDTDRDQNWRTEPILVASRTQNISCLNIWQPTWHFEYLSFATINPSCKILWRPSCWLVPTGCL